MDGQNGGDTTSFKLKEGGDTILDPGYDSGIDKLIFFGGGHTSTNVRATRINNSADVQLSFGGTSNSVLL